MQTAHRPVHRYCQLVLATGAIACATLALTSRCALAQESPYCDKVREHANGDAALLFAPTLQAQGIKFPRNGTTDVGVTTGRGYQFRASLSLSLLDLYKGFRVRRVGRADCQQHEATVDVLKLLAHGEDFGRLAALRKRAAFLESRRADWEAVVASGDARLAAQVSPLTDNEELHRHAGELERLAAQAAGDLERLEVRGLTTPSEPIGALVDRVEGTTMAYEREQSHVRTLDAWSLSIAGGIIPDGSRPDYFGVLQGSFNMGGIARYVSEARYLRARETELKTARYEMHDQLSRFHDQLRSSLSQAKRELAVVERELARITFVQSTLAHADAPQVAQALSALKLDQISVESDRTYLVALVDELTRAQENDL